MTPLSSSAPSRPAMDGTGRLTTRGNRARRQEFGLRLSDSMKEHGPICVGIDPHRRNLRDWGYQVSAEGAELFAMRMLQAVVGRCAAVKFMMPMFERYGSKGIAALERALYAARQLGLITIVDCMRGGLSTTLSSIADAYLKPNGPLYADAITLIPYYGFHSLNGLIEDALNEGHGVFIASLTSNPEAIDLQTSLRQQGEYKGETVAYGIARAAQDYNDGFQGMGSVGLVVGATIGHQMNLNGMSTASFTGPILSPATAGKGPIPKTWRWSSPGRTGTSWSPWPEPSPLTGRIYPASRRRSPNTVTTFRRPSTTWRSGSPGARPRPRSPKI